MTLCELLGF